MSSAKPFSNVRSGHVAEVDIRLGPAQVVSGSLTVPREATGLVLFVHGSGSSRFSSRNRFVADTLNDLGFATLLFDLLTESEAEQRSNVFDIELLAKRVDQVRTWLSENATTRHLILGLFGASTGAAAALASAAASPTGVAAVVSRGGRPDLAEPWLARVQAATLLIVGALDHPVLEWNEQAAAQLRCVHEVAIVPGATHLFEEPGTLEIVAAIAGRWFRDYLTPHGR